MKDLFSFIAVTLGRRYKLKHKKTFVNYVSNEFDSIGYKTKIDDQTSKVKRLINLFVGDIKSAKTIIVVGYDTPAAGIRITKDYYPFDHQRNKKSAHKNLIAQSVLATLLFALIPLMVYFWWHPAGTAVRIFIVLLGLIILACMYYVGGGSGNPVNFNRNSAALTIAMEIARKDKNKKTAFAFIDKTCSGYDGYKAMLSRLGQDEANHDFVLLDCVGHGEITQALCTPKAAAGLGVLQNLPGVTHRTDEQLYPINFFSSCVQISGGFPDPESGVVVKNTGTVLDTVVDMEYMEGILKIVKKCASG